MSLTACLKHTGTYKAHYGYSNISCTLHVDIGRKEEAARKSYVATSTRWIFCDTRNETGTEYCRAWNERQLQYFLCLCLVKRGEQNQVDVDVVRSRRFATDMSRGWLAITVQARLASIEQFRRAQGTSSTFDTPPTTNLFPSPPPPVLPLGPTFRFCVIHLLPNLIVFPRFEILLRPRKIHLSILRSPGNAFDIRDRTRQLYQRP
jgi:hypothetical protein